MHNMHAISCFYQTIIEFTFLDSLKGFPELWQKILLLHYA
ncbi:hypothetical protein SXCC_00145 [Gluconacetobacter sp. SXCC-1]|nr:hypothetical protein SXCC_00145 [Gluconacetobacter sp. SXCC-1]